MFQWFFKPFDYEELCDTKRPQQYSWFEQVFYSYSRPLVEKCRNEKVELSMEDVWDVEDDQKVTYLIEKYPIDFKSISFFDLVLLVIRLSWKYSTVVFILNLILMFLHFASTYLFTLTLSSYSSSTPDDTKNSTSNLVFLYLFLLILLEILVTLLNNQVGMYDSINYNNVSNYLESMIYKKMLKLSPTSRATMTTSKIDKLTSDSYRIYQMIDTVVDNFTEPFKLIFSCYMVFQIVGWNFGWALGIHIASSVGSLVFEKFMSKRYEKSSELYEKRMSLVSDIFTAIQIIKLYGWEEHMEKKVDDLRQKELKIDKWNDIAYQLVSLVDRLTPLIALMITLYQIVIVQGQKLTPELAFFVIHLLGQIESTLNSIPMMLKTPISSWSAVKRFVEYLNLDERQEEKIIEKREAEKDEIVVSLKNANFTFAKGCNWSLKNLNLTVKQGQLVAIVGRVGSGKTGLMSVLSGHMEMLESEECKVVANKIAWAEQRPWIQNKTLRENIVVGTEFDEQHYWKCIEACALKSDLNLLSERDMSTIGHRGVNLSGGQRARVSLTRAVYSKADLYLLDDPFSALDANVSQHIFDNVVGPNGMLSNKTRIVTMNSTKYLPQCDLIIVVQDGEIFQSGTYKELIESNNNSTLLTSNWSVDINGKKKDDGNEEKKDDEKKKEEEKSADSDKTSNKDKDDEEEEQSFKTQAMSLLFYLKTCGIYIMASHIILSSIIIPLLESGSSLFMAQWTDQSALNQTVDAELMQEEKWSNFLTYGQLEISVAACTLIAGLLMSAGNSKASSNIHNTLMHAVIRTPIAFFHENSIGKVVRRFGSDLNGFDTMLSYYFTSAIGNVSTCLELILPIFWVFPSWIIALIFIFVIVFMFLERYKNVNKNMRKMAENLYGQDFSSIDDDWNGYLTIQGFNLNDKFLKKYTHGLDDLCKIQRTCSIVSNWISIQCSLLSNILLGIWLICSVWFASEQHINAGILSLLINNGAKFCSSIPRFFEVFKNPFDNSLKSIERLNEYATKKPEPIWEENHQIDQVPISGRIEFQNVCVKYKEGPLVLKNLSFKIESGQKIGIVGRTGAGKSTIMTCLFRLIELEEGSIFVGDVNIKRLGPRLRQHLTIIPQDPILFTGTVRSNIDPASQFTDQQIFDTLDKIGFLNRIKQLDKELEYEISEGGSNFSIGERQMFCLARALLRPTRFLVLDEASAFLDLETDKHIQKSLRTHFGDSTILTIAHRLDTLSDYDKIMVINEGQMVEFGSFSKLLANPDGYLSKMMANSKVNNG